MLRAEERAQQYHQPTQPAHGRVGAAVGQGAEKRVARQPGQASDAVSKEAGGHQEAVGSEVGKEGGRHRPKGIDD